MPARPADFSTFISGMFSTWTRNFGSFFLVFLILGLITGGIGAALSYGIFGVLATGGFVTVAGTSGISTANMGLLLLYLVLATVTTVVVTTIVEGAMAEYSVRRFRGESMTLGQAIDRGVAKFLSVFGATLLVALIVVGVIVLPLLLLIPLAVTVAAPGVVAAFFLAFLVAIVVVIYVALGLVLFAPAIMMENTSAVGGLSRSWNLMKGHRLSLFGAALIVAILAAIVELVFTIPAGLTGIPAVSIVASALTVAIVSPWFVILTAVVYDILARPYHGTITGGGSQMPGFPSVGPPGPPPTIPPGVIPPSEQ